MFRFSTVDDRYRDDREFRDKTRRDRPERERRYDDESFYRTRSRNAERDKTNRNREVLDKERKYQNYYPQGNELLNSVYINYLISIFS